MLAVPQDPQSRRGDEGWADGPEQTVGEGWAAGNVRAPCCLADTWLCPAGHLSAPPFLHAPCPSLSKLPASDVILSKWPSSPHKGSGVWRDAVD